MGACSCCRRRNETRLNRSDRAFAPQGQLTHSSPGSDLVSGNQPGRVGLGTSKEREDLTDARASTY